MICKQCKADVEMVETLRDEGCPHYSNLSCPECGKFYAFGKKPQNENKRTDHNIKWRKLWKEKGYVCAYCGVTDKILTVSGQWEVDHIYPLSCGGQDVFENTMMLCKFCHTKKHNEQKYREAITKQKGLNYGA